MTDEQIDPRTPQEVWPLVGLVAVGGGVWVALTQYYGVWRAAAFILVGLFALGIAVWVGVLLYWTGRILYEWLTFAGWAGLVLTLMVLILIAYTVSL